MTRTSSCERTHRQLLRGKCPYCDQVIGEASVSKELVWNTIVLKRDLQDPDVEIRRETACQFISHSPPVRIAIPLLDVALQDQEWMVRETASHALSGLGCDLDAQEVSELETSFSEKQFSTAFCNVLAGHYLANVFQSEFAKSAFRKHVL